MTEEEKIQAVEEALDGHAELIAELREAWQVLIDEDYVNFSSGGMLGFRPHHWAHAAIDRATAALGQAEADEIWVEEMNRFGVGQNPEIWPIYSDGTHVDRAALENEIAEDWDKAHVAMSWGCKEIKTKYCTVRAGHYSEETDFSYRRAYAEAFYGACGSCPWKVW